MQIHLLKVILSGLGRSRKLGFNVFDVMRHGTHEKQISDIFAWLINPEGTHNLGNRFTKIFIDEVNHARMQLPEYLSAELHEPFPSEEYSVMQEIDVNKSIPNGTADIADLLLESDTAVLVVENYFTSDGHGHEYDSYLAFSLRGNKRGAVVLLCRDEDRGLQCDGWEKAAVVTYATLVGRLYGDLESDPEYQKINSDAYWFIKQMHSKFRKERERMENHDILNFILAMCETGEARRYQVKQTDMAAKQLADDLAKEAEEQFNDSRKVLQDIKGHLKLYCENVVKEHINRTLGDGIVGNVSAGYQGIYQWTVNIDIAGDDGKFIESGLQVKFGPSAWYAIERDNQWKYTDNPNEPDWSRLFLTHLKSREIWPSAVTLQEVIDGLDSTDTRLHDEVVAMIKAHGSNTSE